MVLTMLKTLMENDVEPHVLRRREASARFVLEVNDLLDRRTELQGVLGLADLIHDGARWAV
jgi:hypothetical protein